MAFHQDLLKQAVQLARNESRKPKQASLRRAVSTAYYALFHFLIYETCKLWKDQHTRARLERAFEHSVMKTASKRFASIPVNQARAHQVSLQDLITLKSVAQAFMQLQEKRHQADYDNSVRWTRTGVQADVLAAGMAMKNLQTIRQLPITREYLFALLIRPRN